MFIYKGKTSEEMGLEVGRNIVYSSPSRDIDFISVQGRNGTIPFDRGRYDDVVWSIPVILKDNRGIESRITGITDWLLTDTNYYDFLWSSNPEFVYRAMCYERYSFDRVLRELGRATISLRVKPIKYLATSLEDIPISNGMSIVNQFNIAAHPLIKIEGSGDVEMKIGDSSLTLRNLVGGCIIDSEIQTITNLDRSQVLFNKMESYPFPTLVPGHNQISILGDVSILMQTRIGALI